MTDNLVNSLKRHMSAMIGQIGTTRLGTITSVNPATYTARVMIQPENVLSGWLPIAATMVGNGWGLVSPPTPGEQVAILAQEGDAEHGVIVGRIFSTVDQPPKTYTDQYAQGDTSHVQSGEIGLVHESGTFLRLVGGKVLIHGDLFVDGIVRVTGDIIGDKNMHAALSVFADVNVEAAVDVRAGNNVVDKWGHAGLDSLRQHYNVHRHPDPQGGLTGFTDTSDP